MPAVAVAAALRRSSAGLVVVVALALLAVPSAGAAAWRAPVGGWVTRGFDLGSNPFEGGRHRGADFAAHPGATVRAACGGEVLVAGRVGTNGRVVTIRCGPWRVTHLPLAAVAVRPGAVVDRGTRIGTASESPNHDGLHLGVRRAGDPFGYADPVRFLTRHRLPAPPIGAIPPRGRRLPPAPAGRPGLTPRAVDFARPAGAGSSPVVTGGGGRLAPWPAWAGLALLLAGAVGARVLMPRRRRTALPPVAAREVR